MVFLAVPARSPVPLYYVLVAGAAAPLLAHHQERVATALQRAPGPGWWRFALVGYGAVVAEETIVGIVHAAGEGSITAVPVRVVQFVAFNVLAFTGIVVGLYVVSRMVRLGPLDAWLMAGGFGLFAEAIPLKVAASPLAGALLMLPTMAVYATIFLPAVLSLRPEERGSRAWPAPVRVLVAWALMFAASIVPVLVLTALRTAAPAAFPACEYIACT